MRRAAGVLLFAFLFVFSAVGQQLASEDEIRIAEAFRLARSVGDRVWKGWHEAPFSVLLVTPETEFLIGHPQTPKGFEKTGHSERLSADVFARPRQFPTSLLATFPAFGDRVPVIVIGQPEHTASKTSVAWVITVLHEHFHQLQNSRPNYFEDVLNLGLAHGDETGMWMLNYPFPYKENAEGFAKLKTLLLAALQTSDKKEFRAKAAEYIKARNKFVTGLKSDDSKYFGFQLWQEGMARYTELKVAAAARDYRSSAEFSKLADAEPFSALGEKTKAATLKELAESEMENWKRTCFYSFGGAEGLLLDRLHPKWKEKYFVNKFSTGSYF